MTLMVVTGGTGTLGKEVVSRLLDGGHEVRITSRRPRPNGELPYEWATVDYRTGTGLADALRGADGVVHCLVTRKLPVEQRVFDVAREAGVPHLVYVSIVGVDRVPFGYYQTKLAAERQLADSGVPYTILRATQFHDLIRAALAALSKPPVMFVPDLRCQPIDVTDVADRLADLAAGPPAGRAPDVGGPTVESLRSLAAIYLRATRRRRWIVPFRWPGKVFRAYREGGHLAPDQAVTHGRSFPDYLADHMNLTAASYRRSRS